MSSWRSALVVTEARSDPAPGSEKSWHHMSSVRRMRRDIALPLGVVAAGEDGGRHQVERDGDGLVPGRGDELALEGREGLLEGGRQPSAAVGLGPA